MESRHVVNLLADKTPAQAMHWLTALRGLMRWAVAAGVRSTDPTTGVKAPRYSTPGHHSWTEDEIAQFEQKHPPGSLPRLALMLLLYTGQRKSDVVRMGVGMLHGNALCFTQQKTGRYLEVPIHGALAPELLSVAPTFIVNQRGVAYTADTFGKAFRRWCDEAGLPERCTSHGLRKAACRRLAEAGCTAPQIASISGHTTLSEVQRYIAAAKQAKLARSAMERIGNPSGNPEKE